ncbi:hypothetical protein [Streptomyces sp. NPDC006552]|uniref:hypothetical protein n=1 Tax=Streptomyces sp. NPDC006552 TaxID=3157179 RepID=UPI0033A412C9
MSRVLGVSGGILVFASLATIVFDYFVRPAGADGARRAGLLTSYGLPVGAVLLVAGVLAGTAIRRGAGV